MIQLIHRDVKIVGQCWKLDGVNSLEDLRRSIIEAAERWAQPFSDEKIQTLHGLESERDKERKWYEGTCFEIWGEFFVKSFGNLSNVDLDCEKYNPNPKVKDFGVDGWGLNNSGENATAQFKFRSKPDFRIQYKEVSLRFEEKLLLEVAQEVHKLSYDDKLSFEEFWRVQEEFFIGSF